MSSNFYVSSKIYSLQPRKSWAFTLVYLINYSIYLYLSISIQPLRFQTFIFSYKQGRPYVPGTIFVKNHDSGYPDGRFGTSFPHITNTKCLNTHIWPHLATFLIPRAGSMCLEKCFVKNYDSGHPDKHFGTSLSHMTNIKVSKCTHRATLGHFSDTQGWPYVSGKFCFQKL